jgi:acyl transferase domain-containing protein/acyl-CoA synthetase (AMP-forming)/AMP-acid ligase II/pimeloyl-ACP methyl ester carboxylesterase
MIGKFSTFVDILRYRARSQTEKVAFTFLADGETPSGSLTYQQLDLQARAIAARLQAVNGRGEKVLLLYPPGLEFISAFLGCLYAGAIATPAYPPRANRSLERLQTIVDDAGAKFALTVAGTLGDIEGRLTQNGSSLTIIASDRVILDEASNWEQTALTGEDLAFLQYTSGSTGTPKGVMVSHGNLLYNSHLINLCFQDTVDSKGVSWLPPYHDMGLIGGILQPLYVGAFMALIPPVAFLQRPYRWLKAISDYRATTSGGPNFAYELCASQVTLEQKENLDLSCWELAFTGAEPVRAETIAKFANYFSDRGFRKKSFYPCYGMAETTLIVSGGNKDEEPILQTLYSKGIEENKAIVAINSEEPTITLVGCGKTIASQELIIVNPDTLNCCQDREIGEIWVSGESVAQGYWQKPEVSELTFKAYTRDTQAGSFLRTGDLGFLDRGELFVTGRIKDLIIIRGRNYYPQDIESTVDGSHPALRPTAGAAFTISIAGEEELVIVQEVQRTALRNLNADEVIGSIRKAIVQNYELQPHAIVLLKTGSIPKTSSGKIQRYACREGFLDGSLTFVGEWGRKRDVEIPTVTLDRQSENIQKWLLESIARDTGIALRDIDPNEPFINYGLDSVRAVRLSAELEDWLGVKLAPTLAYDYPTISSLAGYLAGLKARVNSTFVNSRSSRLQTEIAIVGIGCRFPGANNPQEFWELLRDGKDAISRVKDRWEGDDWGGFLESVDLFDPQFFGISPRETQRMDPQQRLLLEVSWEACENAGISVAGLAGSSTGVFVGISSNDYSQLQWHYGTDIDAYAGTGNAHSIAANRLSYLFDLRGPSLSVDTACSSSLVAVHLACQSLHSGECNLALAGGVNLILSPELIVAFTKAGMMSPQGRCKTFDASADGYVRGEGCGVTVLKRLEDAIKDGDRILAVIKGTAIEQDGRSNGLTAPNGLAQQVVIEQALANAKLSSRDVTYVETHGTGTPLGDPIEVNALKTVLMKDGDCSPCWLGSVKTNIGHLESAAGIAGLIKMVLCLQNRQIPPHLHFQQLNPHIAIADSPLKIPTQLQPWESKSIRIGGVSSFGFGGTNAHAIIGEWSKEPVERKQERPLHIFTLSAKSDRALQDLVNKYVTALAQQSLGDICCTVNKGRTHFKHRLAVIAKDTEQLQQKLVAYIKGEENGGTITRSSNKDSQTRGKIAFLFTGQGSQYVGMGYQLYQTQPTFRQALDRCAQILASYLEKPLIEVLYPPTGINSPLDETAYTQPALFAVEYALAQLWLSWGIKPDLVMGHSVGEYVAACIAGVFSLEDGLKLIAQRGKLMQTLPQNGEMVAIFAEKTIVKEALEGQSEVAIAAINGPHNIVISGEKKVLKQIVSNLKAKNIKTKKLKVSHAFHSPLMKPILGEFIAIAKQIVYNQPNIDLISNVTGTIAIENIATPEYWVEHVCQPVQFAPSIELLKERGCGIFLEIGVNPILLGMGRQCLLEDRSLWLPSLRSQQEDWQQMLQSLGSLYTQGINIDWQTFNRDYNYQTISLPTYPFQRQSYWLEKNNIVAKKQLKTTDFYTVEWEIKTLDNLSKNEKYNYLIFNDKNEIGKQIIELLTSQGNKCLLVKTEEDYHKLLTEENQIDRIIYLPSIDSSPTEKLTIEELQQAQQIGCGKILEIIQYIYQKSLKTKLWIITRGTQKVEKNDENLNIAQSSLWGLEKVIAIEHPEYWGGIIDLNAHLENNEAQNIVTAIQQEKEERIAWRNGETYVPRLRQQTTKNRQITITLKPDRSYLISGGLGAIGWQIAAWLVENGAKHLILISRNQPTAEQKQQLANLEAKQAQIITIQADITNFHQLNLTSPPLAGIIHAAGTLDDGILQGQTWERFDRVLAPKILGAWNLHQISQNIPLDFFITFSSVASLIGSPGQGNYAAANAFLDAIAHYRQAQGLVGLSINWGPWSKAGMAANKEFQRFGFQPLSIETGLHSFSQLLLSPVPQIGALDLEWSQLSHQFPYLTKVSYFEEVLSDELVSPESFLTSKIFDKLLSLTLAERQAFLTEYLQSSLAKIIQIPTTDLAIEESLLDLGMDSLMVMEATNLLKEDLQLMLYPREFYERPRIEALAAYLAIEFEKTHLKTNIVLESTTQTILDLQVKSKINVVQKIEPPIVFILSSPRSGSTLLRVMLERHSQICSPPELHLLPFATMGGRERELGFSQLGEGLKKAFMELKSIDAIASNQLVSELIKEDLSIPHIYQNLIELAGDRLLVDKSPTYANSKDTLDRAEAIFKNAKYIHLIRHPYAAIESFARMRMDKLIGAGEGNPYQIAESIWANSNQNILEFFTQINPKQHYLVRYEELVAEPAKVMQGLCEFLGIEYQTGMLNPYAQNLQEAYDLAMNLGDPNFFNHQAIEPQLGEVWQKIQLPNPLNSFSQEIAQNLQYQLLETKPLTEATMRETLIDIRGLRMCLCSWGPEEGPLVLCLHGILEQGAAWSEVAIRLAQQGYRVIAPDFRGHGRSAHAGKGGSYNLLDFLSDIDAIVENIADRAFTLVGHSLGSVVAAIFASIRPQKIKNLILVETVLPSDTEDIEETAKQLVTHLDYLTSTPEHPIFPNLAIAAERLRQATPALSETLATKLAERITEPCEGGVRWRWAPLLRTRAGIVFNGIGKSKYLGLLRRIAVPITLVYGDKSNFNRQEDLSEQQAAMPAAQKIVLSGGHNLHLETPSALARAIQAEKMLISER